MLSEAISLLEYIYMLAKSDNLHDQDTLDGISASIENFNENLKGEINDRISNPRTLYIDDLGSFYPSQYQ
jgi:hypothetical protein